MSVPNHLEVYFRNGIICCVDMDLEDAQKACAHWRARKKAVISQRPNELPPDKPSRVYPEIPDSSWAIDCDEVIGMAHLIEDN